MFTLPDTLNGWVTIHPKEVYDLLFDAVWGTLSAFGADPKKRRDGQLGMTAMLHTWGQTLVRHVHLHCLVPGGANGSDGTWPAATSTYLFPVRALSRHVRGGLVSRLRQAYQDGRLPRIADAQDVDRVLKAVMATEWVVDSKPCLARPETVVDYLGRCSHRIALSDRPRAACACACPLRGNSVVLSSNALIASPTEPLGCRIVALPIATAPVARPRARAVSRGRADTIPSLKVCPALAGRDDPRQRAGIGLVQHTFIRRARPTAVPRPPISAARPTEKRLAVRPLTDPSNPTSIRL